MVGTDRLMVLAHARAFTCQDVVGTYCSTSKVEVSPKCRPYQGTRNDPCSDQLDFKRPPWSTGMTRAATGNVDNGDETIALSCSVDRQD
jgi:hypothetical protein